MSVFLESVTSQMLLHALDRSVMQHAVIANNVANVNTENFKPFRLEESQQMNDIAQLLSKGVDSKELANAVDRLPDAYGIYESELATEVILDQEIVELTKNTLNYQALLTAKSKMGNLLSQAISGRIE